MGFFCSGALLLYFKRQRRTMDIKKEHRRGNIPCYSLYDIGQIMVLTELVPELVQGDKLQI